MAIKIFTSTTDADLTSASHWWGFPDLPEDVTFPVAPGSEADDDDDTEDLLTFICQIKLEEIAPYDPAGMLPHEGMLYFFASLDYFLGDPDADGGPLGFWPEGTYRVVYSPTTEGLHTHRVVWADGTDACLPAEAVGFGEAGDGDCGHKLLGTPFFDEVSYEAPGLVSLLQIDEDERWGLRFYDCGMLNFLISPEDLAAKRFDKARLYFHCM